MPRLDCVIFDLDNTLVDSRLDFGLIKREIGTEMSILEYRADVDAVEQARVDAILDSHESREAERCRFCAGAREVLDWLGANGVRSALLTRNSRKSLIRVCERLGMVFDVTLSREDSEPKPSPAPILHICDELKIEPARTLMVGDYLYDMQSAERAGAMTMLVDSAHRGRFEYDADHEVADLHDAIPILEQLLNNGDV